MYQRTESAMYSVTNAVVRRSCLLMHLPKYAEKIGCSPQHKYRQKMFWRLESAGTRLWWHGISKLEDAYLRITCSNEHLFTPIGRLWLWPGKGKRRGCSKQTDSTFEVLGLAGALIRCSRGVGDISNSLCSTSRRWVVYESDVTSWR